MDPHLTDLKKDIESRLSRLETLRDEIRVKLHLAGMEAKDEWNQLEPYVEQAERAARETTERSRTAVNEAVKRLEDFFEHLS